MQYISVYVQKHVHHVNGFIGFAVSQFTIHISTYIYVYIMYVIKYTYMYVYPNWYVHIYDGSIRTNVCMYVSEERTTHAVTCSFMPHCSRNHYSTCYSVCMCALYDALSRLLSRWDYFYTFSCALALSPSPSIAAVSQSHLFLAR